MRGVARHGRAYARLGKLWRSQFALARRMAGYISILDSHSDAQKVSRR